MASNASESIFSGTKIGSPQRMSIRVKGWGIKKRSQLLAITNSPEKALVPNSSDGFPAVLQVAQKGIFIDNPNPNQRKVEADQMIDQGDSDCFHEETDLGTGPDRNLPGGRFLYPPLRLLYNHPLGMQVVCEGQNSC